MHEMGAGVCDDRRRLLQDGYVILREVVPPAMLEALRDSHDRLVEAKAKVDGIAGKC